MMKKLFLSLAVLIAAAVFAQPVFASIEKFAPGDTIVIGDFVYDDNLVATTSPCTITMSDPTNTIVASGVPMTALATGWHYYSTSTLYTQGLWPTTMTCGSIAGGDLANLDKSFVVGFVQASTSQIADAVNVNTVSALNAASSSIIAAVNANTNSSISSAVTTINNNTNATVLTASTSLAATIPLAVWSSGARSLTTFGTLAADVWANGTRTLTSGGGGSLTASDVWTYATRNLTDGSLTSGALALQSDVTNASSSLGASIAAVNTAVSA